MQPLKFNFCHSIKGTVRLFKKAAPRSTHALPLEVNPNEDAGISLDGLPAGKWKATVEWEYDGRNYVYSEDFEIEK